MSIENFPNSLTDFLSQEPNELINISAHLDSYKGRLQHLVRNISATEVLDFNADVNQTVELDEKNEQLHLIKESLLTDFSKPIPENIAKVFNLSEYRNFFDYELVRLPIDEVAKALWQKQQILKAFNHPLRIKVRQLYQELLNSRLATGFTEAYPPLPQMKVPSTVDLSLDQGQLQSFEEYTIQMRDGRKFSRRLALAIGCYTALGGSQIGIPFGSETMHTVIGNPTALADLLRCHAIASAPRNGVFKAPEIQAQLLQNTINLLKSTALLEGRIDREKILKQWTNNMGILVEPDPYRACRRIEIVLRILPDDFSINHVRIYMVEGANEMIDTAQAIKHFFPQLNIYCGQVISEDQFLRLQELSIAGVGIGIASGSRCSTGARSGVASQNINFLYKLRKQGAVVPIFSETGIPNHAVPIGLAAGIRRINGTGNILGFLSANGGWYVLKTPSGSLLHPYDGEASFEGKYQEEKIYTWDMPQMIEGVVGWFQYSEEQKQYPTIPHRLWYLTETVALTTTFNKHLFHEDLIYDENLLFTPMSSSMKKQVLPKYIAG